MTQLNPRRLSVAALLAACGAVALALLVFSPAKGTYTSAAVALLEVQTMAAAKNNLRPERKCLLELFMILTPFRILAKER